MPWATVDDRQPALFAGVQDVVQLGVAGAPFGADAGLAVGCRDDPLQRVPHRRPRMLPAERTLDGAAAQPVAAASGVLSQQTMMAVAASSTLMKWRDPAAYLIRSVTGSKDSRPSATLTSRP